MPFQHKAAAPGELQAAWAGLVSLQAYPARPKVLNEKAQRDLDRLGDKALPAVVPVRQNADFEFGQVPLDWADSSLDDEFFGWPVRAAKKKQFRAAQPAPNSRARISASSSLSRDIAACSDP